jgi:hypothetical protein
MASKSQISDQAISLVEMGEDSDLELEDLQMALLSKSRSAFYLVALTIALGG